MSREHGSSPSPCISRRGFLGAGLSLGGLLAGRIAEAEPKGYRVTGWSGDEFEIGHRLRDGWLPREPKVWKRHEVVVVGAGISGMTAAFKLRGTDLLVLETGAGIGGNARSAKHEGWEFNIGSAYIVGIEGEQGKLWSELGVKLKSVRAPLDRWFYRGKWYDDPWRDETIEKLPDPAFRRAMVAAKRAFKAVAAGKDFPLNPYQKSTAPALALDRISFAEWCKPFAHPELMAFLDSYCYGAMGAPASVVSAYGGINFYVDVVDERAYAWSEGNHHLIKVMAAEVRRAGEGRIQTGCTVHKVVPVSDDLARVYYVKNGEPLGVEARRVILAVPYFVAGRMIDGLGRSQRYALTCQSYTAYVVANLCFDKVVSHEAFDNWAPRTTDWEDYLPASWVDPDPPRPERKGQVIGAFAGAHHPALTRFRMLTQRPEAFAARVVSSFERIHPGSRQHLRHVYMTRWGHAFLINRPGMFTRWLPNLRKRIGPLHLAHADGQGLPAVEASTNEAAAAAYAVLARWKKKG